MKKELFLQRVFIEMMKLVTLSFLIFLMASCSHTSTVKKEDERIRNQDTYEQYRRFDVRNVDGMFWW